MRIWSLHPKYLDAKGLVALWRETLLAKNVLQGNTKGYKNHPQLIRFRETNHPLDSVNQYLIAVYQEAKKRGYNFNKNKTDKVIIPIKIKVTSGQVEFERTHLLNKLLTRDNLRYIKLKYLSNFDPHPMFEIIEGDIESWEIT